MRAAGVVVALLMIVASARVARAQPGATDSRVGAPPPASPSPRLGFAVGVDAHLAFGDLIHTNVGARGELIIAGHHALVVRAGVGSVEWAESEQDSPTYREWFGRLGYRVAAEHIYAGLEVGGSAYLAHFPADYNMPARTGSWFGEATVTALVGWKLGPVDLGLDYTKGESNSFGVFLGAGYRRR